MPNDHQICEYPITEFLASQAADLKVSGRVRCSPKAKRCIGISLITALKAPRSLELDLTDPMFHGKLNIALAPGDSKVSVHTRGRLNFDIKMWRNSTVIVGAETTANRARIVADNCDVIIGEDNLWSDEIILQSHDQHGIYDMQKGELIRTERRFFRTEDHVWIGRRSMLMGNLTFGFGSIIGAGSIVTRDAPAFSILGGNPARVIAGDRTWSRSTEGFSPAEEARIETWKARESAS